MPESVFNIPESLFNFRRNPRSPSSGIGVQDQPKYAVVYRLERWKVRALAGLELGLKEQAGEPLAAELDAAKRHIGELSMDNVDGHRDLRQSERESVQTPVPLPCSSRSWKKKMMAVVAVRNRVCAVLQTPVGAVVCVHRRVGVHSLRAGVSSGGSLG